MPSVKETLDTFYHRYNFRARLRCDPISFAHRYSDPDDIELAAFVASCFAYGRVELFTPVIERILAPGAGHLSRYIKHFSIKRDGRHLNNIRYRFNNEQDILCLLYILQQIIMRWGSLRMLFYTYYSPNDVDIGHALRCFVSAFMSVDTSPVYGKNIKPSGLVQLLPSPDGGSACKRLNMFLRWMVRTKDIDFGIWNEIPPSKLIIPLDTHIARIARCICLTNRKSADWKTAKEITDSLRRCDPLDPLKYDFALCHHGISGMCKGEVAPDLCSVCHLNKKYMMLR